MGVNCFRDGLLLCLDHVEFLNHVVLHLLHESVGHLNKVVGVCLLWACAGICWGSSWGKRKIFEGSLEVKLLTIWRDGKSQRGEEQKREDQRGERERRKKMQVREKVGKSPLALFFQ